ncbi:MAG: CocE/NonD family hydrolase [Pseudomonadota bacterium]
MSNTFQTLKAAWPVLERALASGQVLNPQCNMVPADPDIEAMYNVEIPLNEGFSLTANIFRSKVRSAAHVPDPVVMCAHPYDNRKIAALEGTPFGGPPQQYRLLPQSGGTPTFSTLTSWESPDPNFWVPAGYTLVNLNLPGFANSGGPASVLSRHQGQSYREAITWVGNQNWCDGHVGLCGVSFLCISQYLAAATPVGETAPEALKCIIPWEGISDIYRDLACRGGVEDIGFLDFWWKTEVSEALNVSMEEYIAVEGGIPLDAVKAHPFYDDYWKAKAPPLENITVPMLLCASFSDHELHTFGSFRAFEKAQSTQKWLYTHRSGKWTEFYKPEVLALQKDFMDQFLKGKSTQFDDLKPVRIETRSRVDEVKTVRWEPSWPLEGTKYVKLHLQDQAKLSDEPASNASEASYDGTTGTLEFDYQFASDTEITGYLKLRVWVEARAVEAQHTSPKDLIVCCFVDKIDHKNNVVRFYGSVGQDKDVVSRGYGRASRRMLDAVASRDFNPVPLCASDEFLKPKEVVPLDIALCPTSTFFHAGEKLRLTLSARDIVHAPIFRKDTSANSGRHVLHFGGAYDSHLMIPMVEPPN